MTALPEIATLMDLYDNRFNDMEKVLAGLPAEALLWRPFAQSPWQGEAAELGRILAHALSSTVYLIRRAEWVAGRVEWGEVEGDEGSEEFGLANHDPAYLRARLERVRDYVHSTLPTFDAEALSVQRPHPRRPERLLTARWDITHALEHMAEHVGHAHLTRQLWAVQNG